MWWFAERNGARSNPSRATVKEKPLHFGAVFLCLKKPSSMWWFAERSGARSNPSRATVKEKPLHFWSGFFYTQ